MSHDLTSVTHHSNVSNLVDLYEPIRHFGRALRGLDSSPFSDLYHARYSHHDKGAFSPDFDLQETPDSYHFEGEFPGVKDCSAIKLQWIDQHTLRIEGVIEKTDLTGYERQFTKDNSFVSKNGQGPAEPEGSVSAEGGQNPWSTRVWLRERRTGSFTRTFSFPVAVATDAIEARLSQGLLRMVVPKIDKSLFKSKIVPIKMDVD